MQAHEELTQCVINVPSCIDGHLIYRWSLKIAPSVEKMPEPSVRFGNSSAQRDQAQRISVQSHSYQLPAYIYSIHGNQV